MRSVSTLERVAHIKVLFIHALMVAFFMGGDMVSSLVPCVRSLRISAEVVCSLNHLGACRSGLLVFTEISSEALTVHSCLIGLFRFGSQGVSEVG